jgi:hypothetical protein
MADAGAGFDVVVQTVLCGDVCGIALSGKETLPVLCSCFRVSAAGVSCCAQPPVAYPHCPRRAAVEVGSTAATVAGRAGNAADGC